MSTELKKVSFEGDGAEDCEEETRVCVTHGEYQSRELHLFGIRGHWSGCDKCQKESDEINKKLNADFEEMDKAERWQGRLRRGGFQSGS